MFVITLPGFTAYGVAISSFIPPLAPVALAVAAGVGGLIALDQYQNYRDRKEEREEEQDPESKMHVAEVDESKTDEFQVEEYQSDESGSVEFVVDESKLQELSDKYHDHEFKHCSKTGQIMFKFKGEEYSKWYYYDPIEIYYKKNDELNDG